MAERELTQISVRVDKATLEKLRRLLGTSDNSKAIRGAMNFTVNVSQTLFGGELDLMFKRKKDNEEIALFDQNI